jgi:hypothetical protein
MVPTSARFAVAARTCLDRSAEWHINSVQFRCASRCGQDLPQLRRALGVEERSRCRSGICFEADAALTGKPRDRPHPVMLIFGQHAEEKVFRLDPFRSQPTGFGSCPEQDPQRRAGRDVRTSRILVYVVLARAATGAVAGGDSGELYTRLDMVGDRPFPAPRASRVVRVRHRFTHHQACPANQTVTPRRTSEPPNLCYQCRRGWHGACNVVRRLWTRTATQDPPTSACSS